MILDLILALGLTILFSEDPSLNCNSPYLLEGCYSDTAKRIVLNLYGQDVPHTFSHEMGHSIFYKDTIIRKIIKGYAPLRNYCTSSVTLENYPDFYVGECLIGYTTEENRLDERIANYYAQYKLHNTQFSIENPSLYILFRDKENNIINSNK